MRSQKGLIGWFVLLFVVLLALSGYWVVMNFKNSLPGDLIYPVKENVETLKLSANELSFAGRADIYLGLSAERLGELQELVKRKSSDKLIITTLEKLEAQQDKAITNINIERGRGTNVTKLLEKLDINLQEQQIVFQELIYERPGPAADALQKALSRSFETLSRLKT